MIRFLNIKAVSETADRIGTMADETVAAAEDTEHTRQRVQHCALPDAESQLRTWRAIQGVAARCIAQGAPQ